MTVPGCVVFLNGSYGVGKSSTLEHVGDLLAAHGQPFSLMDVDWFHRSWPPADDDPDNVLTEAANLAAVWAAYRRTGPRQPVVAGVVATEADRRRYEAAFDLPLRTVRLVAPAAVVEARLRRRYTSDQADALDWHLRRHEELSARLAAADLDDLVVDTEDRSPHAVAVEVLRHFDLVPPAPVPGGRRAAVVVLDGDRLLVIRRRRHDRRYAVLPGGGVEVGEDTATAALRELGEETGLVGVVVERLWTLQHDDRPADYFLVDVPAPSAVMTMTGPESRVRSATNSYEPCWIRLTDLDAENLRPSTLRPLLRALVGARRAPG